MNTHRSAIIAALALALPLLCGCKGPTTVSGKVISGDLSFIGIVDATDPRLKGAGLAETEISARGVDARSDRIITDGRSGKAGDFTLRIEDPDAIAQPALFHAHLAGYADARQPLAIPPSERRILIVLKPIGTGASAPPK